MSGQNRSDIYPGLEVDIILKKDQRSGKLTRGVVKDLLTSASYHSRGIKVRLEDGQIGRVAEIVEED
ncbi:MAG: YwbE family protein [Sphingobacteriales bacterium]|nr:MAG: YwbE family protein [Sphingobacteriales bacterium]